MSENEGQQVIVVKDETTKKDELKKLQEEYDKLLQERDDLEATLTAHALKSFEDEKSKVRGRIDDLTYQLIKSPDDLKKVQEKLGTIKSTDTASPANKGSGGVGSVPLESGDVTNPKTVEDWMSYYLKKPYSGPKEMSDELIGVISAPSLYKKEQVQAVRKLLDQIDKKSEEEPKTHTVWVDDREVSKFGKAKE